MTVTPTLLDVEGWRAHLARTGETLHVYLDGVDVTRGAYRAAYFEDGIHGEVNRYTRNADGQYYRDPATGTVASETLTGVLVILPGEEIPR
jgi:hypothetical protein